MNTLVTSIPPPYSFIKQQETEQLSTQTLMIISDQSHKIDDLIISPITSVSGQSV